MSKNNLLLLAGGVILGALLTATIMSGAVDRQNGGMVGIVGMGQSRSMMGNGIDRHFIEQMIPHHEDAITMANIALQRAEHPEIKQLAQDIVRTQSDEITQMRRWYKDWFGQDVPDAYATSGQGMGAGMMRGGMMGTGADVTRLQAASPFDKTFIEQMIPHHQMAVMMAQMLKASSPRPEMRQLAQAIIDAQTKEINQMRGWYSQWYK